MIYILLCIIVLFIEQTEFEIICLYVKLTNNICVILQNKILNLITFQFLSSYTVQILELELLCMTETNLVHKISLIIIFTFQILNYSALEGEENVFDERILN